MKIAIAGDSAGEELAKALAKHLSAQYEVSEVSRMDSEVDASYAHLSDRVASDVADDPHGGEHHSDGGSQSDQDAQQVGERRSFGSLQPVGVGVRRALDPTVNVVPIIVGRRLGSGKEVGLDRRGVVDALTLGAPAGAF